MINETAHGQRVRLMAQANEAARKREADRLELLATPRWGTSEVVPVIDASPPDPDAPAPDGLSTEDWMRHENERVARRARARGERGDFYPGPQKGKKFYNY